MKKNIIIIGSNSVIAKNFLSCQKSEEFNFVCVSRAKNSSNRGAIHISHDLSLSFSNETNDQLVLDIKASINNTYGSVLCLFAWSGTPRSSSNPAFSDAIKLENLNIITNISCLIKELGLSQVIFLSSAGGIYDNTKSMCHDENSIPAPTSPYGVQKLEAESTLANFSTRFSVPLCIYRVSCAYGFNSSCPDQGVLNKWIFDGLLQGQINVYNSLDSQLNFIGYDQVSLALELGIRNSLEGIYNIGSSDSTPLLQIYNGIAKLIPELKANFLGSDIRTLRINSSKFKAATGFDFDPKIEHDLIGIFNTIKSTIS